MVVWAFLSKSTFYWRLTIWHSHHLSQAKHNQVKTSFQIQIFIKFAEKALQAWHCRQSHKRPSHMPFKNLSNFRTQAFRILRIIVEILDVLLLLSDKKLNLSPPCYLASVQITPQPISVKCWNKYQPDPCLGKWRFTEWEGNEAGFIVSCSLFFFY